MFGRYRGLRDASLLVWFFALGYFLSYIPYSALAKAITRGYLAPEQGPVPGIAILPASLLGTIIAMPLVIAAFGGFHFTNVRQIAGLPVPFPRKDTFISGLGFAAIIASTTLAFSFSGISIVLALVLMRAGVLTLAPLVDLIAGRRVHPYSATALILSFCSVAVVLSQFGSYELTIAAIVNLAFYLCGYFVRLNVMSRYAKVTDEAVNRRFIAEECMVAMAAIAVIAAVTALMGSCGEGLTVECAWRPFIANPFFAPAFVSGVAYGFLGVFATLIYLNRLENSFAIPVFCGASLLAGLSASVALGWFYGAPPLSSADIISAGLIIVAGFALYARSTPEASGPLEALVANGPSRFLLFVCSGNTSRSPIAQAICNAEIVRRLARCPERTHLHGVQVESAGLTAKPGAPMTEEAQQVLGLLGVPAPAHASRHLTAELIDRAGAIICMTEQQCRAVLAISPAASGKVHRLHPFRDLPDPTGSGPKAFLKLSRQMQRLIGYRLSYFAGETGGSA